LRNGDIVSAGEHLVKSGEVEPYHTLSSFGPIMVLALELLQAGETEAVLTYFERCAKFWNCGFSRLDEWSAQVREGLIPDFGRNLRY
jgi:hypothetical protein